MSKKNKAHKCSCDCKHIEKIVRKVAAEYHRKPIPVALNFDRMRRMSLNLRPLFPSSPDDVPVKGTGLSEQPIIDPNHTPA